MLRTEDSKGLRPRWWGFAEAGEAAAATPSLPPGVAARGALGFVSAGAAEGEGKSEEDGRGDGGGGGLPPSERPRGVEEGGASAAACALPAGQGRGGGRGGHSARRELEGGREREEVERRGKKRKMKSSASFVSHSFRFPLLCLFAGALDALAAAPSRSLPSRVLFRERER